MADLNSFVEMLINKTSEEVNQLAKVLEEEYGIKPINAYQKEQGAFGRNLAQKKGNTKACFFCKKNPKQRKS